MTDTVKQQIQALVDLETKGWDTKDSDLFLSMIRPDMAWPWLHLQDIYKNARQGMENDLPDGGIGFFATQKLIKKCKLRRPI